jgi:hypothetical protein
MQQIQELLLLLLLLEGLQDGQSAAAAAAAAAGVRVALAAAAAAQEQQQLQTWLLGRHCGRHVYLQQAVTCRADCSKPRSVHINTNQSHASTSQAAGQGNAAGANAAPAQHQ